MPAGQETDKPRMKSRLLPLLAVALFPLCSLAIPEERTFHVDVDPSYYAADRLPKSQPGLQVTRMPKPKSDLPSPTERDVLFSSINGLSGLIESYDGLSRDQLFIRARTRQVMELKELYPHISKSQLEQLRSMALAWESK